MSQHYQHLLAAGQINALKLRNRIVLAAMGSNFAEASGHCNKRLIAYYEAHAKGGAQVHRSGDCRDKRFIDGGILDARKLGQEL